MRNLFLTVLLLFSFLCANSKPKDDKWLDDDTPGQADPPKD